MPHSGPKRTASKLSEFSKDQMSLAGKSRTSRVDMVGEMEWLKGKTLLKPEDQLQLTEAELQEEIARVLVIHNPRIPDSLVEWSHKYREFVKLPNPPHLVTLLNVAGTLLHRDSEEAKVQIAGGFVAEADVKAPSAAQTKAADEEGDEEDGEEDEAAEATEEAAEEGEEATKPEEAAAEQEAEPEEEVVVPKKPKKIRNQFNFCDRGTLTYRFSSRDMTTQTIPPPTATFNSHSLQWIIFDEYQEDFAKQQREKEKEKKFPALTQPKKDDPKKKAQVEAVAVTQRMLQAAKTLERMVNQNIFDEIANDYRYWNDPSDEFKEGEGSLLPLWKFHYEKTKKHDVTDLCFNSRYYDLFAVAFGTMAFESPIKDGSVCLFSVKNPSYPEWVCPTDSPVMCVDFSKNHPHLLVIGTLSGAVAVYNVMLAVPTPQYKSKGVEQKHGGLIWEVRWGPDTEEGNLTFYSVSIDGKINHWILNQTELGVTTVMTLFLDRPPLTGPDGTLIHLKACGTCIAFHPAANDIFMVGSQEGSIYKCNTAYSSVYMKTYSEAHNMPIYRIAFNKFNSNIFATCSGDWRIKIWEDDRMEPLFMFDLGVAIGDVQWAPYSSTVVACVSDDGKVTVFDLNVNKYRSICSQQIVSKKRSILTRLAFNEALPFIIVGDDKGTITTLKLSPNLRVKVKPSKKQLHLSHAELETMKLEKLLSFVREPPTLTPPKDTKSQEES